MTPRKMIALGAGIACLSFLWAYGFKPFEVGRFAQSYLFSYLFILELSLGAMALLMISNLTGGAWGERTRPLLEASTRNIPFLAVLFIPLWLESKTIYPWLITPLAGHQALYLNFGAFTMRAVFYLGGWSALSYLLIKRVAPAKVSALGLVFLGLTVSFAAIDWQMSLEPHWYSTIYGLIFLIGQALGAWAFTLLVGPSPHSSKTGRDLGNILLALVMLWAYLSFMQYLIIWSGDLPEEVTWINRRTQQGWQYLAFLLIAFQFAAPFLFLLFRSLKNRRSAMILLCSMLLVVRILDRYWMVMPALHSSPQIAWCDFALLLALSCIWAGAFRLHVKKGEPQNALA